jgi:hypothetical protein
MNSGSIKVEGRKKEESYVSITMGRKPKIQKLTAKWKWRIVTLIQPEKIFWNQSQKSSM